MAANFVARAARRVPRLGARPGRAPFILIASIAQLDRLNDLLPEFPGAIIDKAPPIQEEF
jgi:hypothetical protein